MIREWERSLLITVAAFGLCALVLVWIGVEGRESGVEGRGGKGKGNDTYFNSGWDEFLDGGQLIVLNDNPMKARVPRRVVKPGPLQTDDPTVGEGLTESSVKVVATPEKPTPGDHEPPPASVVKHFFSYRGYLKLEGKPALPYVKLIKMVDGETTSSTALFIQPDQPLFGYRVLACGNESLQIEDSRGRVSDIYRNAIVPLEE